MLKRILPAVSLVALAGCQPYYGYAPPHGSLLAGGSTVGETEKSYTDFNPLQSTSSVYGPAAVTPAVFTPTLSAKPLPAGPGGDFQVIDSHAGAVGFWNEDPVLRREVAAYPDRYVERIDLKNGGAITYEALKTGTFSDDSDADLIRADLDLPPFRARGIMFEPSQIERLGPFTYLAQSSAGYNCFIFRGKFRADGGGPATSEAYGNVCYPREIKDLGSIKAEMLDLLTHARFGKPAGATLVAAAPGGATRAPAVLPAAAPLPAASTVSFDRCPYAVSFSAAPLTNGKSQDGGYAYAEGSYGEKASCACTHDYAKISQFDAVDNVRREAQAQGFTLQKATFDKTASLGRELAFQGSTGKQASEAFLVGRSFYGRCRFTVVATGTSYADLLKAQHFIASVATKPAAAPEATAAVYGVKVTDAEADAGQPAPPATPVTPVDKADLATSPTTVANASADTTPSTADPSTTADTADKPVAAATAAENADAAPPAAEKTNAAPATTAKADAGPTPLAAAKPTTDSSAAADNSAAAASASGSSATPIAAASTGGDEVAQRLRRLKLLFDQKLITRQEYEAKREAILKTL